MRLRIYFFIDTAKSKWLMNRLVQIDVMQKVAGANSFRKTSAVEMRRVIFSLQFCVGLVEYY